MVGGGLAGSSLARTLALEGAAVLVVERERVFRDRVRGEVMATWGTVEAKRLDLFELLRERCATEIRYLTYCVKGVVAASVELPTTAPHFEPSLAFHQPVMQGGSARGGCVRGRDRLAQTAGTHRLRVWEVFDRVPELEIWTYGPEAHCDDAVRAELLA